MRPVDSKFRTSQGFGSMATGGVLPSKDPNSGVAYYVYLYGNYQQFGHAGDDIACGVGTPVRAMASGTVLWADWAEHLPGDETWGWAGYFRRWALYKGFPGIVTVIQHPWGIGIYAHLSNNDAAPRGSKVVEGQIIGLSGDTKTKTTKVGAHLHVEALVDLSYKTGGGLIYGRTNPTKFYGSAAIGPASTPATPKPPAEEDEKLLIIGKTLEDNRVWVGDGATRRHIPDPDTLASYIWYAEQGWLKIKENGKVQTLSPSALEALGIDVTTLVSASAAGIVGKIEASSAVELAELIPDSIAQDVVEELVERLKAK